MIRGFKAHEFEAQKLTMTTETLRDEGLEASIDGFRVILFYYCAPPSTFLCQNTSEKFSKKGWCKTN